MSTPFLERLRSLRALEDQLADALRRQFDDCDIHRGGNTIAAVAGVDEWGGTSHVLIDLTHLAQELARDLS